MSPWRTAVSRNPKGKTGRPRRILMLVSIEDGERGSTTDSVERWMCNKIGAVNKDIVSVVSEPAGVLDARSGVTSRRKGPRRWPPLVECAGRARLV